MQANIERVHGRSNDVNYEISETWLTDRQDYILDEA